MRVSPQPKQRDVVIIQPADADPYSNLSLATPMHHHASTHLRLYGYCVLISLLPLAFQLTSCRFALPQLRNHHDSAKVQRAVIIKDTTTKTFHGEFCDVKMGVVFSYLDFLDEGSAYLRFNVDKPIAQCTSTGYVEILATSVELLPDEPSQLFSASETLRAYPQLTKTFNIHKNRWESSALNFIKQAQDIYKKSQEPSQPDVATTSTTDDQPDLLAGGSTEFLKPTTSPASPTATDAAEPSLPTDEPLALTQTPSPETTTPTTAATATGWVMEETFEEVSAPEPEPEPKPTPEIHHEPREQHSQSTGQREANTAIANRDENPWNFDGFETYFEEHDEPPPKPKPPPKSTAQPTNQPTNQPTRSAPNIAHIPVPKLANYSGLQAVFPLATSPLRSFTEGIRRFGAYRQGGTRLHAGIDLYTTYRAPIYAVAAGTLIDSYYFAQGTFAHEVDHESFIIRYCEVKSQARDLNRRVDLGEMIGEIGDLAHNANYMLHLEMYKGTEQGWLTPNGAEPPFRRRADLVDPTEFMTDLLKELP